MAAKARDRGWQQEQIWAREREAITSAFDAAHAGHHSHLNGSMHECSCGDEFGVTCVAFRALESDEEARAYWDALACRACGKKGVWGPLGEDP